MSAIEIHGAIETVQTLPKSDSPVDLSVIEGWESLSEKQQYFLYLYFKNYPKKTQTRMEASVSHNALTEWLKQDSDFKFIFNNIESLHVENLSALHYEDAHNDPRIRKDVLKSMGAKGYENKNNSKTTNILNTNEKSLPEILKSLND